MEEIGCPSVVFRQVKIGEFNGISQIPIEPTNGSNGRWRIRSHSCSQIHWETYVLYNKLFMKIRNLMGAYQTEAVTGVTAVNDH